MHLLKLKYRSLRKEFKSAVRGAVVCGIKSASMVVKDSNIVIYNEEYFLSSRGFKLFTCRWLPAVGREIKSLVFLCHGYGMECSVYMQGTGIRLAELGYAVFGIDYYGHGKSEGHRCYIPDFSSMIKDFIDFSKGVREREEYKSKARFLLGESMGGAVALLVHRMEPQSWSGAVLVAPMCKISEKLYPPKVVVFILKRLATVFPTWKIVPVNNVIDAAFKDPQKRKEILSNPYIYRGRPRLKTSLELLNTSLDLERQLEEVSLPFLVLHGEDDSVTDPAISKHLYETAKSLDKTLRTYPGMWHGLIVGEPKENAERVLEDIAGWLNVRSSGAAPKTPTRGGDNLLNNSETELCR